MNLKFSSIFRQQQSRYLWILFGLLAVILTARNMLLPPKELMTHYNNFLIFKQSFFHLISGTDLYQSYPKEHYDLFKYTPTFALLMGAIAWLPDAIGLGLWNLLNVWLLVFAIRKLPVLNETQKLIFGLLLLQETITSTMNSQSNTMIAALLILAWISLENGKNMRAVFFILGTAFIKIFGIVFLTMLLCYPKWQKSILPGLAVFFIFLLIPLPVTGFRGLYDQYISFFHLLQNDHGNFVKYSVTAWMQSWFHVSPNKNILLFSALIIQLFPLVFLMRKNTSDSSRNGTAIYAGTWLIWMVIFNHMAESATYIIAVAGVMLWFFYTELNKWYKILFLIPVMAFTCFGPSDIYPPQLRENIVIHWQLKVFPCILIWVLALVETFRGIQLKNQS